MSDEYGAEISMLEFFRDQIIRDRGLIENETDHPIDVILDLLDRCIEEMKATP